MKRPTPLVVLAVGCCWLAGCSPPSVQAAGASQPAAAMPALDAKHKLSQERMARAMQGLAVRDGLLVVTAPTPASPAQARSLMAAAQASLVENSWFVCCEAFGKALCAAPRSVEAYEGFATAAMTDVKTGLAEAALRSALRLDPSRTAARYRLAEIRQMDGDYAEARREWGLVAEADPGYRDVQSRLALAAYFEGDIAEARRRAAAAAAAGQAVPPQFAALLAEAGKEARP
jgi:cytochrome c-type biogenesis protein CcmH/NrfG